MTPASSIRCLLAVLFLGLGTFPAGVLADPAARAPVERFQTVLLSAMRDGAALGFEGRRERLGAMLTQTFDLPAVTRAVIGRHYGTLSPARRNSLGERIEAFAAATLASRFKRFDGERFEPARLRRVEGDVARVASRFVAADGATTSLDYALRRGEQGWRIINVWFDGVSGTDIQRAEFEVFLRSGGADRLQRELDALIARLSNNDT